MRPSRHCLLSLLLALCILSSPAALAQNTAPYDAFPNLWVADNSVRSMDVVGDTLYIGGDFEYVGPPTGQLAVLDKQTGEPDLSYPRFDAAEIGSFHLRVALPDGQGGYYVGGDFRFVSGQERRNLAHVLADGTLDPDFRPDPVEVAFGGTSGYVDALHLAGGVLYVGGRFNLVGGEPRQDLAALDTETGAVLPLSADFDRLNDFNGMRDLALSGSVLYLAGEFGAVNGQPRAGLAAVEATTGALLNWAPVLTVGSPDPDPFAMRLGLGDFTLYVGGAFETVGGQPRDGLAEVTLADPATGEGGEPTPWAPSVGALDFVVTEEYVWGAGSYSGGPLAQIDRETGAVVPFPVDTGLSRARAIAFDPVGGSSGEGTFYLVCKRLFGGFDSFPVVVGVDPATGESTGYEVLAAPGGLGNPGDLGTVAIEPGPEGRVFTGGSAVSVGGVRRGGLAALDLTTGRALPPFNGEIGPSILDVEASPDGRTVYFSSLGSLGVLDVPTWSIRRLGESGARTAARPRARATHAGGGSPRLLGGESAFAVTEDVVYFCPGGCEAYDRRTEDLLWVTPGVTILGFGRPRRALLLDGPGGPGGSGGTLFLSGAIVEIPVGVERAAFAALDPQTGAVLDWDVGVELSGPGGSIGTSIAGFDRDGAGPAAPALYLGGENIYQVQGEERANLLAVDPVTAALLPWDPGAFLAAASGAAMAAQPTDDGGLVYVTGGFRFVSTEPGPNLLAFDAATGAPLLEWQPAAGGDTMVLSERHGALFLGGFFRNSLRGSGHAGLVAVEPAAAFPPPVASEDDAATPERAALSAAHPNPFRGTATVTLSLPQAQRVAVALFDVLGRRVAVLYDGPLAAGEHALTLDATALPSGVYVVRAQGEAFSASRRVTVVR